MQMRKKDLSVISNQEVAQGSVMPLLTLKPKQATSTKWTTPKEKDKQLELANSTKAKESLSEFQKLNKHDFFQLLRSFIQKKTHTKPRKQEEATQAKKPHKLKVEATSWKHTIHQAQKVKKR